MLYFSLNKLLVIIGAFALIFVLAFLIWWQSGEIQIINENKAQIVKDSFPKSSISGVPCEKASQRPIAVMLASDPITRPLSGISQADIVFEMPVTPSGATRMMAVYQCNEPSEIGSVRSAREDFILLAAGLKAVYVHWGGEREALKKLDSRVIDNIDAMVYETVYFYRKKGIHQPHNGFTSFDKLMQGIKELKYLSENQFTGYSHTETKEPKNIINLADRISIDYPHPFYIEWVYDKGNNVYKRSRGGEPETDRNNGRQTVASVVVVMETTSKFLSQDYLSVVITGEGNTTIYQNGTKINGKWQKGNELDSKLFFYDNKGKEIEFTPGKIWVEIITE